MGFFNSLLDSLKSPESILNLFSGVIEQGRNKNGGGHDHRTNTGNNRTPAQKEGDKSRRKD